MSPAQLEKLKPAGNMFLQVLGVIKVYKVSIQHPALKNGGLVHSSCLQHNIQTHPWTLKTSLQSSEEEHLHESFTLTEVVSCESPADAFWQYFLPGFALG